MPTSSPAPWAEPDAPTRETMPTDLQPDDAGAPPAAPTLLATKLFVPPPPAGWVARPRVDERLSEGMRRKLTLIAAPAGFGT